MATLIIKSFTSSTVNPIALPYFNFDVQRNVTVTVGQTAFIHCRVERLGDKDIMASVMGKLIQKIEFWDVDNSK
uniref:Ig-like domain-containing protein n=1 Tax=Phlebotomus papatasi TaxID=29031 RepID=A0A1B0GNH8_PHLPP